jgi:hypothetical protein
LVLVRHPTRIQVVNGRRLRLLGTGSELIAIAAPMRPAG